MTPPDKNPSDTLAGEQMERIEQRSRLEHLVADATDAETERDRRHMEEAILATVAKAGPSDPIRWEFVKALMAEEMTFTQTDLAAIAVALRRTIEGGNVTDTILIQDKLPTGATVPEAVLKDVLEGSKAKDVPVALEYIEKLASQDRRKRAADALRNALAALEKGQDPDITIGGLLEIASTKKIVRQYAVEAEAAVGFLDTLKARRTDDRDWAGLGSGFTHLNEVLNGLTEGLFVLAGAPSTGKTTLAWQIANHVAQAEKVHVLFYSFEQSQEELRIKSFARLAQKNSREIWKGRLNDADWERVENADAAYRDGPGHFLTIIQAGENDTVETIRTVASMAKLQSENKPVLLIVDYLQIIPPAPGRRFEGIRERVDWNLSELRRLARDLKSPVLVVSSLNREGYKSKSKGNQRPTLASMKESGGIEYGADAVLCLWRDQGTSDELTAQFKRPMIRIELLVLKNRNGELARVKLNFTPEWAEFNQEGNKEDLSYSEALGDLL